jgi:hypothetical protein
MGQIFTTDAVTFTRPADTTAYAAQDVVGINLAVTGATNASPIVVTTAAHGLATGDVVTIASVGGNTAANGTFRVTVVSSTTFQLDGTTGNAAYTSGGTVAKWLRMKNVTNEGGSGILRGWKLSTNTANVTLASFSLAIFKGGTTGYQIPVAATLDNAALVLDAYTNHAYLVHKTASASITAATLGTTSGWAEAHNLGIPYDLVGTSKDLWVQVIAEAGYAPASAQTFSVSIDVEK